MENDRIFQSECYELMKNMQSDFIDVIYMDPPFYSQTAQRLTSKSGNLFSFEDKWDSLNDYLCFMKKRLEECRRILADTGSIFVHCDQHASHYLKMLMDEVFGMDNFQSEIVWVYKRWSNAKKGLLNNHQIILFYSKTAKFKFNKYYMEYSETTNIDQILQERVRDKDGKTKYKTDADGNIIVNKEKKGVPLSDVWEIPFLNPKAKERVGYPTQKPVLLLERIIKLVSDEGDIVFDPFMGSGTTLVASKILNRDYFGCDISAEAVHLTEKRLECLVRTDSMVLKKGRRAYKNLDESCEFIMKSMRAIPVQRNNGIDGFFYEENTDGPVAIRVQRADESISDTVEKLEKACEKKNCSYKVVIRTQKQDINKERRWRGIDNLAIIDRYDLQILDMFNKNSEVVNS